MTVIRGVDVDERGRCAHWRTERDVVAHRCETCGRFWACHECHRALADHPFGRAGHGAVRGLRASELVRGLLRGALLRRLRAPVQPAVRAASGAVRDMIARHDHAMTGMATVPMAVRGVGSAP